MLACRFPASASAIADCATVSSVSHFPARSLSTAEDSRSCPFAIVLIPAYSRRVLDAFAMLSPSISSPSSVSPLIWRMFITMVRRPREISEPLRCVAATPAPTSAENVCTDSPASANTLPATVIPLVSASMSTAFLLVISFRPSMTVISSLSLPFSFHAASTASRNFDAVSCEISPMFASSVPSSVMLSNWSSR